MPVIEVPDPPFGDQTEEAIRDRMFAAMSSGLDQSQGSLAWNLVTPMAIELSQMWDDLDVLVNLTFIQTATGLFLDARAEEHGVFRLTAVKAESTVVFSGDDGTVPAGVRVSNTIPPGGIAGPFPGGDVAGESEPRVFVTLKAAVISGGSAPAVNVEALDAGQALFPSGEIDRTVDKIGIVDSVTNDTVTSKGRNEETDEELRTRLLDEIKNREGAGAAGDYERWAKEASSEVFFVSVNEGTAPALTVYLFDVNFDGVGASIITTVADYIALRSPIGSNVTVADGVKETIAVNPPLSFEVGFDEGLIDANLDAAINAYFATLDVDEKVLQAGVIGVLMAVEGVLDVDLAVLLDAVDADFTPAAGKKAVPGTISYT